jgi:hypothetical protein
MRNKLNCCAWQQPGKTATSCGWTWDDVAKSIFIAAVNVRFFRFKKAVVLALAVGAITVCLTALLAVLIYYQTCATVVGTVFLPFIDQQVSGAAECEPVTNGTDGWLLSDWSATSEGNFSRTAAAFYTRNLTNDWYLWPEAVNETFDLYSLHTRVDPSRESMFAPVPINCTTSMAPDASSGAMAWQEPCFRRASQALPRLGNITWTMKVRDHSAAWL